MDITDDRTVPDPDLEEGEIPEETIHEATGYDAHPIKPAYSTHSFAEVLTYRFLINFTEVPQVAPNMPSEELEKIVTKARKTLAHDGYEKYAPELKWCIVAVWRDLAEKRMPPSSGLHLENLSMIKCALGDGPRPLKIRIQRAGRQAMDNAYLIQGATPTGLHWHSISVDSALTALQLCLTQPDDISDYCIKWGLPFMIFCQVDGYYPPPRRHSLTLVKRKDERWYYRDFQAYEIQRKEFLHQNPRVARAALMCGGILWRLVIETESLEYAQVLAKLKPSGYSRFHSTIAMLSDGICGYDDALSMQEIELIIGAYHVPTGQDSQSDRWSWWPTPDTWKGSGLGVMGCWTDGAELWYQNRLQSIRSQTKGWEPKTGPTWITCLTPYKKKAICVLTSVEDRAQAIVNSL